MGPRNGIVDYLLSTRLRHASRAHVLASMSARQATFAAECKLSRSVSGAECTCGTTRGSSQETHVHSRAQVRALTMQRKTAVSSECVVFPLACSGRTDA